MISKIRAFASSIVMSLLLIFVCFAILDSFWLGWLAQDWYKTEMAPLLRQEYITWPWIIFYITYGSVTFVLAVVANRDKPWFYATIDGGLLGLASYGAYNLTAYSIIEGFSLFIMTIDWSWGIVITACSATAGWIGYHIPIKANDSTTV